MGMMKTEPDHPVKQQPHGGRLAGLKVIKKKVKPVAMRNSAIAT